MNTPLDEKNRNAATRNIRAARELSINSGGISEADAVEIFDPLLIRDGKPTALALSATPADDDYVGVAIYQALARLADPKRTGGNIRTGVVSCT